MAIVVKINSVDETDNVVWDSLSINQQLTSQVDSASFSYRKYGSKSLVFAISDVVQIYDDSVLIFAGTVININESTSETTQGLLYNIECVDYTYQLDSILVSSAYESMKTRDIIADMVNEYVNEDTLLDDCEVTTNWVVSQDAINLATSTDSIRGDKCFEFDLDVSVVANNRADLRASGLSFDITDEVANDGCFLLWFYKPTGLDNLSLVQLYVGSTLWSDYITIAVSTDYKGDTIVDGWNLLKFDLANKNVAGSPNYASIVGFIFRITYGAGQTDVTGIKYDELRICPTDSPFTTANVIDATELDKIVFNQIPFSEAMMKLTDVLKFEWYPDYIKDIHFFSKFTNPAPYDLTDTSGNYIYQSIERVVDGTQITNQVKVRGGVYDGASFTDYITVVGSDTLSFNLPYKFSNLEVELDIGAGYVAQTVGIDFIDKFVGEGGTATVLYNYQQKTIRFETALADADSIKFTGLPKIPVLAIASDASSIATYGLREKIIRDTSIEDLGIARKRAKAEVLTYKDPVGDVTFRTYTAGLRTGQVINYTSTQRGINVDYIINNLTITADTPNALLYTAEIVTTRKYGLIEYLRKLSQSDLSIDESEVAEIIKVDAETVTITESITKVTPVADDETVSITESIEEDPLGADTEPFWVLGGHYSEDPDMLARYRLDEKTGTIIYDASQNGNDGTITNATFSNDADGNGLLFTGSSSYVSIPTNILSGTMSISMWVKFTDMTRTEFMMINTNVGGKNYFYFSKDLNNIYAGWRLDDAGADKRVTFNHVTAGMTAGVLYNLIVEIDSVGGTRKIYLSNTLKVDSNATYTIGTIGTPIYLSHNNATQALSGVMGMPQFINRLFTADERTALSSDINYKLPAHTDTLREGRLDYSLELY